MTNRFWLLIFCVFALVLLGMATLSGSMLLLAVPLLAYLGLAALNFPGLPRFKAERSLVGKLVEQEAPVAITVTVENYGSRADEVTLEDIVPYPLVVTQGTTRYLGSLVSNEKIGLDYTVRTLRGQYRFDRLTIELRDHFDLFCRTFRFIISNELQATPTVPHLTNVKIRPHQTRGFSGPIQARLRGSGMTFWGVREFHLGDSLRQINWKISSRHQDSLFTNEFEMERIADVGLILDARQQTNIEIEGERLFEYSVLATAALAEAFLADGHRVSMLTYGYGMQRIFPGYGKVQRERILFALTQVEPGSNFALEDFNHLPTRLFPAKSQLVVVSPLSPRDIMAFSRLRQDGYGVLLVSPNPVFFEARSYHQSETLQQAVRLAKVERSLWLRRLTRMGVQVVDWQVDQPLEKVIRTNLAAHTIKGHLRLGLK